MKKFAIAIPTYNEFHYLKNNLNILLPQIDQNADDVDLYVYDNFSSDCTKRKVIKLFSERENCFYICNEKNTGISENQLRCLSIDGYQFQMVLGSDDILIPGAIEKILQVISEKNPSIIYLNYYSYINNYFEVYEKYAPNKNILFKDNHDFLMYPSVGHFSGYIFKSKHVKNFLPIIIQKISHQDRERFRGIIGFLGAFIATQQKEKVYFYGERLLATLFSKKVSYTSIEHRCVDYLDASYFLFSEKITKEIHLEKRKRIVKNILLKSSIRDLPFIKKSKNKTIFNKLLNYYNNDIYFKMVITPIFYVMRITLLQLITRFFVTIYLKANNNKFYEK